MSGTLQDFAQIFDDGAGPFAIDFWDLINLGTLQAQTTSAVAGAIPANTPVFGSLLPPMPFSGSTSLQGQLTEFTGTGELSFELNAQDPNPTILDGPTITGLTRLALCPPMATSNWTTFTFLRRPALLPSHPPTCTVSPVWYSRVVFLSSLAKTGSLSHSAPSTPYGEIMGIPGEGERDSGMRATDFS